MIGHPISNLERNLQKALKLLHTRRLTKYYDLI
jgi:hypothetical protein